MIWTVSFSSKAAKQAKKLPKQVKLNLAALYVDLARNGPFPSTDWPNYSKLHTKKQVDKRHCHLIKGKPTYVCCWEVFKQQKLIEVYYVGTHEKAPY